MPATIRPVHDQRDLEAFLKVPYRIYAGDPNHVFPLLADQRRFFDQAHNPFYTHAETALWIARDDAGRPLARVAACVDSYHNRHTGEQSGFFGFYECPDDPALARELLQTAAAWLKERGLTIMRGPCSFTTNHDYLGLLVDGDFGRPVVGMPYNPRWYEGQFAAFGLVKSRDLWAWRMDAPEGRIPDRVRAAMQPLLAGATFTVRPMDMRRFAEEAATVRAVYNAAWSKNWGFIPMDDAEFAYAAKDMKKMVSPDFMLIAEADGKPIGFSLTIPDFNQATQPLRGHLLPFGWLTFLLKKRRIDYARCLLLGVLPEYRGRGVDAVMIFRTFEAGFRQGIRAGECSWILEDNRSMNRIIEGMGAKVYRTYRIYDKPLA
jgi:GNAT superfamily N-acetyltransferase